MKTRLCILSIVIQLIVFVSISCAQSYGGRNYDGNWWVSAKDRRVKNSFIAGFLSGVELGYRFSSWDLLGANKDCGYKVTRGYYAYKTNFLATVNVSQIADGLDLFYSDVKNKRIKIYDAVWIVLNIISGRPDNEVKEMIENYRKNS